MTSDQVDRIIAGLERLRKTISGGFLLFWVMGWQLTCGAMAPLAEAWWEYMLLLITSLLFWPLLLGARIAEIVSGAS